MSSQAPETTWFRLAVRGIGILMLAWGVPALLGAIGGIVQMLSMSGATAPFGSWAQLGAWLIGPAAEIAVGLYLLIGARGLISYCCRGALGMCPACNYDVRNVPGAACPECGAPLPGRHSAPESIPEP